MAKPELCKICKSASVWIQFILLFPALLFSQELKKNLLFVPLSPANIELSAKAQRNLHYNHIEYDSMTRTIMSMVNLEVNSVFEKYSIHSLKEFYPTENLPDTVYELKKRNCFYFDTKDKADKNIQNKKGSRKSYHNNYYGVDLKKLGVEILRQALAQSNCQYILLMDLFEISSPNAVFSLHIELFDRDLKKIYGNKSELNRDIGRTMYNDLLKYYVRLSCDDILSKTENYLKQE